MGNHFGYTINGPPVETTELPIRPSMSPSVRREQKLGGNTLRNLYQYPVSPSDQHASLTSSENGFPGSETRVLPLTPPMVEEEYHESTKGATPASQQAKTRSIPSTPVNQPGPPTPDNTPPREKPFARPFLGTQPSMASTRAESFETAHENFSFDRGSASSSPVMQTSRNYSATRLPSHLTNGIHTPSPLAKMPITNVDLASSESSPAKPHSRSVPILDDTHDQVRHSEGANSRDEVDHNPAAIEHTFSYTQPIEQQDILDAGTHNTIRSRKERIQRGRSLRERLEASQRMSPSPSTDKFASIIGWSNDVRGSDDFNRRWSGVSNTSTVEAFLVETPRIPKKRNTLRHVSKNESLRSASSPLPTSNRTSMQSSSDSPHRLIHKKAKIGNHNRLSFGSDMSHSLSLGSNAASKVEVIRVAIIPERSSSLQQSASSSRRQSISTTGAPTAFRKPRSSDGSQRKRALTDTTERSRDRYYPPQVPPRASSLSAPTSRNTSRANSITSDHTRFERRRAEKDLRITLDRMELERLAGSLKSEPTDIEPTSLGADGFEGGIQSHKSHPDDGREQGVLERIDQENVHVNSNSRDFVDLRRPSMVHTPFSQPSFMSASPEISEAKMISLHVHNNYSVQLIEPFPLDESFAVGEVRRLNKDHFQTQDTLGSPLRIVPRPPPHTSSPQFQVTPATPQNEVEVQFEDTIEANSTQFTPKTPPRPVDGARNDSFARTLLRNVSLRNARNKKADQELDSTLHPFWRPRPFWDGIEGISPEKKRNNEDTERGIVNNSLGLPQQRLVMQGPLALVRRFSERRRNEKRIAKQPSYSSLHRLRTGRQLYRLPGLGMHLHLMSLREIQENIQMTRQKRADEKRQQRREALRKSIGPNVIATGDSRFPATMIGEELQR